MPFTGAHPLAVAPLLGRRYVDSTALVIGSMSPDFQYFVYGHEKGTLGHSLPGLLLWCLPMTILAGELFHRLVKWPLLAIAPPRLASRLVADAHAWTVRPLAIVVSALIGAASHDVWDSFTHSDGFFVNRFPGVLRTMVEIPGLDEPMILHRVLQYVCSLIGAVAVTALAVRAVRRRAPAHGVEEALAQLPRTRARVVFAAAIVVACAAVCWQVQRYFYGPTPVVVACVSGMLAGVLAASVICREVGLRARSVSGRRDT